MYVMFRQILRISHLVWSLKSARIEMFQTAISIVITMSMVVVGQEVNMTEFTEMIREMQTGSIGEPDPKVGELVSGWQPGDKLNPEEMGTYLESDILMPQSDVTSEVVRKRRMRWPNGIVPVQVSGTFNSDESRLIGKAMRSFSAQTCISFIAYNGRQRDYVQITNGNTGCWAALGRMGGRQRLNLQSGGCTTEIGTPIHELMHAIGIPHEQSRRDRDNYVSILRDNIQRGQQHNFDVHDRFSGLGVPYDYMSVMHYGAYAFSRNRQPTITTRSNSRQSRNVQLGQRQRLTRHDVAKINTLYGCTARTSTRTTTRRPIGRDYWPFNGGTRRPSVGLESQSRGYESQSGLESRSGVGGQPEGHTRPFITINGRKYYK